MPSPPVEIDSLYPAVLPAWKTGSKDEVLWSVLAYTLKNPKSYTFW